MAKIYVDPGHGGKDTGAIGVGGRKEADDNLRMGITLKTELERRGHQVRMSRTTDTYVPKANSSQSESLNWRAKDANAWGADYFISCHRNSYSDPQANGTTVLIGKNASAKSKTVQAALNDAIVAASGMRRRELVQQGTTVLQVTTMPANTIEVGFVTNVGDNQKFDASFVQIIQGLCDVIEAQFGKGSNPAPDPAPTPDPTPSVGSYKMKYRTYFNTQMTTIPAGETVEVIEMAKGSDYATVKRADGTTGVVVQQSLGK